MKYRVLACDYDGTLAYDGVLNNATVEALDRLLASGRSLVMVTGRELKDLKATCQELHRFDWIVGENGGVLYCPKNESVRLLCEAPDPRLVSRLRKAAISPLSVGHAIVATREPHEAFVVEVIRELGLELQVIFNKGAVMVLPTGVNKASGLAVALQELKVAADSTVGIGDAENDHAFLELCNVGVAVSNALPALQERADMVTRDARGAGVVELIDLLLLNDLAMFIQGNGNHSRPRSHDRECMFLNASGDRRAAPETFAAQRSQPVLPATHPRRKPPQEFGISAADHYVIGGKRAAKTAKRVVHSLFPSGPTRFKTALSENGFQFPILLE